MSQLVGLSLDEALRAWLAGGSLPAHPATAEATLFAFAQAYHRANPEVIASIDALEALCLLMAALSSTLASGTHVQPLERRQFVAHCRLVGLEGGELVEQLFSGITARPIPCAAASSVSRHVRHIFSVPTQHEGWLRFEEATAGEGAPVADRPAD
ncbi:MAG: Sec7 domain-containing protein, partial [Promethearchaeia archaeon]